MPTLSKQVSERHSHYLGLKAVFTHQGFVFTDGLTPRMGEPFAQAVGGQVLPDAEAELTRAAEALLAADEALVSQSGDVGPLRGERDRLTDVLRGRLVSYRGAVTLKYGEAGVAKLGFDGETPDTPTRVLQQVDYLLNRAAQVSEGLSKLTAVAEVPGLSVDPAVWAELMRDDAASLFEVLTRIPQEQREAEEALEARDAALRTYDETYTAVAGLCESLLRLAGRVELADRVRPSRRRPGRSVAEPETFDGTGPAPAADDEDAA